jgi:hypothetical protein
VLDLLVIPAPLQAGTFGHTLLDHVRVARPHTLHQLLATLEHVALLCGSYKEQAAAVAVTGGGAPAPGSSPRPCLLVVDSVSAVVGPVLGMPQHSQGYTLLASCGRMLRHLAITHRLAVLVTNHAVASRSWEQQDKEGSGEVQQRYQPRQQMPPGGGPSTTGGRNLVPAMGESWRNQVHVRITLQLTPEGPEGPRRATLSSGVMVRI